MQPSLVQQHPHSGPLHVSKGEEKLWIAKQKLAPVLRFSKLNYFIFGYFDPHNIFPDNENK